MIPAVAFVLATAAVAQAASSNPYIPADISSGCSSFLNTLNSDTSLTACTSSLISASSSFGPNGNYSKAGSADKTAVSSALSSICSTSTSNSCSSGLITGKLASFYAACGPELTSAPNEQVKTMYDSMYILEPLLASVCSKDDAGAWCVLSVNTSSAAGDTSSVAKRAADDSKSSSRRSGGTPSTINSKNIPFLFLLGSLPKDSLCTTCTRNVLTNYISFEGKAAYAPGLAQSVLISGQPKLYSDVVSTCGADFLTSAVKAAGGLGQGSTDGESAAMGLRAGGLFASVVAMGVAALVL